MNLRCGDEKVATFCMVFVCYEHACQHLHATRLWRGSGCGAFHRTPMSSRDNSQWPTDRERLGYVCNPRSLLEGTETLCPHATILNHSWLPGTRSRLLSVKPNEWMHRPPFIPVCTGSGVGMQNPLANIHWRFLLKSEMIGASMGLCRRDIKSPFPPSGNVGYVRNRDVLKLCLIIEKEQFLIITQFMTLADRICIKAFDYVLTFMFYKDQLSAVYFTLACLRETDVLTAHDR